MANTMTLPTLSALEARVIGVLFEKQHTTPDVYPMTVNALVAGCNQKTSRTPVMEASESDVKTALESLKSRNLVIESYGASGRVLRYAQNLAKVLGVGQATAALAVTLMLRGAQTAAELRANADRLYQFADLSSVEAYLEEMAARSDGALALKLPRQPGAREARWVHLLCGPVDVDMVHAASAPSRAGDELAVLRGELEQVRAELQTLREWAQRVATELGIPQP